MRKFPKLARSARSLAYIKDEEWQFSQSSFTFDHEVYDMQYMMHAFSTAAYH